MNRPTAAALRVAGVLALACVLIYASESARNRPDWPGRARPRPAWLPDPKLTPGAVLDVDPHLLCTPGYSDSARDVTDATKRLVFKRYGLSPDSTNYEVDHLVPLVLGGANDVTNLFPQPYAGKYGAREKDKLEVRMHREYCAGRVDLATAQAYFRGDWTAAYDRFIARGAVP